MESVIILDFFVKHSRPSGLYDSHQKKPKNIYFCLSVHFFLKRSPFILAVCQSQNLYNLLHLAASHGLWMVASFVLQQDGSREALRRADAQGQTAADVAKSRGHKKLGKLFTR